VTPIGSDCVGVAFLWSESGREVLAESATRWESLQRLFPRLVARLEGATPCSRIRGAGPLERASRARTSDRFALVGDAAGYVDAITGEGISLSLLSSVALARILPDALRQGATRAALAPYEREFTHLFRRYAFATRGVLAVVRRRGLRRGILRTFRRFPRCFDWLIGQVVNA
jgi:flavin-dependent dehydrogenase